MNRAAAAAALLGACAVLSGAFGAHALRASLDARALELWRTAVDYHFWHALALLAAALAPVSRWRSTAVAAFAAGILVFSGSLYALALGAPPAFGFLTPLGGIALIAGWCALAGAFLRTAK
jgi:uncharacterized membrane protein YgdD (TMEM256/DUF423 family)